MDPTKRTTTTVSIKVVAVEQTIVSFPHPLSLQRSPFTLSSLVTVRPSTATQAIRYTNLATFFLISSSPP